MDLRNKENIDYFLAHWGGVKEVYFWGASDRLAHIADYVKDLFDIKGVYDNNTDKQGKAINGIKVLSPAALERADSLRILILAEDYLSICEQLARIGLKEYIHFYKYCDFMAIWQYVVYGKIFVNDIHVSITTRCTLNCLNCNFFMPLHKNKADIPLETIKNDMDNLFSFVDRVGFLSILGGEPFLHEQLGDIIDIFSQNYCHRIGTISFITNGTVVPPAAVLEKIKNNNMHISISDYTKNVNYAAKLSDFTKVLAGYGINYQLSSSTTWLDFGYPTDLGITSREQMERHYKRCSPVFKGVNRGRFYPCHLIWSAQQCGAAKDNPLDYLELARIRNGGKEEKLRFVNFTLGYGDVNYLSMCANCRGCDREYRKEIEIAVQEQSNDAT